MGAPVDIKVPKDIIDPVIIAQMEYDKGVIPIDIVDRENKWLLKKLATKSDSIQANSDQSE